MHHDAMRHHPRAVWPAAQLHVQRSDGASPPPPLNHAGNSCRSVLAQAVMRYMLDRLRKSIRVVVECASIGEPAQGPVDPRVVRIAREMALPLQPVSMGAQEGRGSVTSNVGERGN